ncbi:copper chaperone PCu(A)C [Altererythrobacter sp. H2]|uniref:copper chaperone PCu(A)C n=1 Tax=Altererythrobacter sp. H2 TaxID=3108391 RepID=UPI002B4C1A83|nr:copper chaperone PCu(A)C [Altererythrobacter sp. H2]WRK97272.1 copper chaperone PCu(A)C [Altererythrobacter sp. H2]
MKASVIWAGFLLLGVTGLGACGEQADEAPAEAVEGVPGLSVTNARLVLPAVSGNPAAVYFDVAYDGTRGLALSSVAVEGAEKAEFHEYAEWDGKMQMQEMLRLPIKQGDRHSFEPGGKHVMAMNISPDLAEGGTANVTLTVSGGGTMTFPAEIKAAGSER